MLYCNRILKKPFQYIQSTFAVISVQTGIQSFNILLDIRLLQAAPIDGQCPEGANQIDNSLVTTFPLSYLLCEFLNLKVNNIFVSYGKPFAVFWIEVKHEEFFPMKRKIFFPGFK